MLERKAVGSDVGRGIRAGMLLGLRWLAWRAGVVLLLLLYYARGPWVLLHMRGRLPLLCEMGMMLCERSQCQLDHNFE